VQPCWHAEAHQAWQALRLVNADSNFRSASLICQQSPSMISAMM